MLKFFQITLAPLIAIGTVTFSGQVFAHGAENDGVEIHEGYDYESCYFDLHPELTKDEFKTFAREAGQIAYFRPIASAQTLGQWKFNLALGYSITPIDDSKGAWNNTMSHPGGDHYLGTEVALPQLRIRMGVSANVDVEAYGTLHPESNFGLVGLATKIRLMDEDKGFPVSLAIRPSIAGLVGPKETSVASVATEVLVSRMWKGLAPFAGLGLNHSAAFDRSDDTDVGHVSVTAPIVLAGLDYNWKFISLGAQAEYSTLATYSLRIGGRF